MSQICSFDLAEVSVGASEVLHLPGTACEISPLEAGIAVHWEEPGTTCTSIGSENRTKDF